MKSFSTCCAAASLLLLLVAAAAPAAAGKRKLPPREELINYLLGPDYSQWLVGAIAHIATDEEIASYLEITEDEVAERFITEFWERRRDQASWLVGGSARRLYELRAEEADKLYTEGTHQGRRTDRGTIFVLYGPPGASRFDVPSGRSSRLQQQEPVESWGYSPDAPVGLDGKRPEKVYRFQKQGDLTVFYRRNPNSTPF